MKRLIMIFLGLLTIGSYINVYALETHQAPVIVGEVEVQVYNVETTWGKMEFTYNEQINYEWNSNTNTYELTTSTYKWSGTDNFIEINNKSTKSIDIELNYNSINNDITGIFDKNKATIKADENMRFVLELDGELVNKETEFVKVGLINLLIK